MSLAAANSLLIGFFFGAVDGSGEQVSIYRVPCPLGWLVRTSTSSTTSPGMPTPNGGGFTFLADAPFSAAYAGATVTVAAAGGTYTRSGGSYVTDGFQVGQLVYFYGFTNPGNNGLKVLTAVAATILTVANAGMVNENTVACSFASVRAWQP